MCLGIPGQIIEIVDVEHLIARVEVSGIKRNVNIACVVDEMQSIEACIGEWVLVHVGFAMTRIDEEEAAQTLKILDELGELQEELDAMHKGAS